MFKTNDAMRVTRRGFGQTAMVATASLAATAISAQSPQETRVENSPGWIDAHVHVWNPDLAKYPISSRYKASDMRPPSFTDDELFSHCKPVGVDRIVLIQMSFYQYDHTYMCEVMQANEGVFSGVALIDYRAEDVVERVDQLASQGMRGFRVYSSGETEAWVNDPGMNQLWKKAGADGLAICPLINPAEIPDVDALCQKYPETTVVVDHFARVGVSGRVEPESLEMLCRLSRFPNAHVKTSAFYALGKKSPPYEDLIPMIRKVVDRFGPERLMWASDCPYQVQGKHNYESSISLIRDRVDFLSDSDKQWMLRGTAEKVFFG